MKIRIRAITIGMDIDELYGERDKTVQLFYKLSEKLSAQNFPVDTQRIVFSPIKHNQLSDFADFLPKLESCDNILSEMNVRWFCLPVPISEKLANTEFYTMIPKIITRFPKLFVHFSAVREEIQASSLICAAKAIIDISRLSSNGYDNFRIGVGCNIRPNTPFFPFSFHDGAHGFSLAVDLIGAYVAVMENLPKNIEATDLHCAFVSAVAEDLQKIEEICREMEAANTGFVYKGLDCSLAPYPQGKRSVAYLLEQIAPHLCGDPGTLTATAFLTKMIRAIFAKTGITPAGFNGVMFSPLEDSYLAKNLGRNVNIEKLMLYSTVCGCGIDMVPIAGSVTPAELASLIQDVMVLSSVHNKPLGVRVLPIPTKMVNEMTEFNHDFFVNSRILPVEGQGLLKGKIFDAGGII
jgi:uncharacterized protein (UPF0210 family)